MKNTMLANGKRKVCRIFDAGEGQCDRYTVAFRGYRVAGVGMVYPYLASGVAPFHPMGFGQHGEVRQFMTGRSLGKRVSFESLPDQVQRFILQNI